MDVKRRKTNTSRNVHCVSTPDNTELDSIIRGWFWNKSGTEVKLKEDNLLFSYSLSAQPSRSLRMGNTRRWKVFVSGKHRQQKWMKKGKESVAQMSFRRFAECYATLDNWLSVVPCFNLLIFIYNFIQSWTHWLKDTQKKDDVRLGHKLCLAAAMDITLLYKRGTDIFVKSCSFQLTKSKR